MKTPRKRKPSRLVTTPFPRVPDLPPSIAGLRMPNSMQTLTAALDAQRVRIDALERKQREDYRETKLHVVAGEQRTNERLAALESRPSLAARVRAWWRK